MKLKVGDIVTTSYGTGVIVEVVPFAWDKSMSCEPYRIDYGGGKILWEGSRKAVKNNSYYSTDLIEKILDLGKVMDELNHKTYGQGLTPPPEKSNPKFALFYGFNGILAKKYSVIEDKTKEEIRARMLMLKLKTPLVWSIHEWEEFEKIVEQFASTPNALIEIPFDDAMSILRVGQLNEFEKFIEAETEEFTDKCIPGKCKPGNHFCGK